MGKYNRSEYIENQEKEKEKLENMIKELAVKHQSNPKDFVEALHFGSKFYQYSPRNNQLIYAQNPYATYTDSYKGFKNNGYNVNKGQHGLKILVPVKVTYLKIKEQWVKLSDATKKQKEDFKNGKIESHVKQRYKVGTVFDISQTDCPTTEYPKMFHMGYESQSHKNLYEAVKIYCEANLDCPVRATDVSSISLRGYYLPETHEIHINDKLNDTEKLSTLTHELGHAQLHKDLNSSESNVNQQEFEADALSIMLQYKLGIPFTDSHLNHLSTHFNKFNQDIEKRLSDIKTLPPDKQAETLSQVPNINNVLGNVFHKYKGMIDGFTKSIDKTLEHTASQQISNTHTQVQKNVQQFFEPINQLDMNFNI